MLVGHVKEIVRHPVKSFTGESVQQTNVMEYGLYGDRSHGFADETRPGKFLTITQFPEMVRYRAKFMGEEGREKFPEIEITTPEGNVYTWGDTELIEEIKSRAKRDISLVSYSPTHVPFGAIEEEHLLLVTDASVTQLQDRWGKGKLDTRRFRPNLYLSLVEKVPFIEEQWLGQRLRIGAEVEILLKRHCERCMIITVDPDHGNQDPSLLKTVAKERENCFGVYASVEKTGPIRVGDEVHLLS